jgi:hypothetical protein
MRVGRKSDRGAFRETAGVLAMLTGIARKFRSNPCGQPVQTIDISLHRDVNFNEITSLRDSGSRLILALLVRGVHCEIVEIPIMLSGKRVDCVFP